MSPRIVLERQQGVTVLTLNRPDKLNAIDGAMLESLGQCLTQIETDADCRAVVVTGAGRAFCAGADLNAFDSGDPRDKSRSEYYHITSILHEMPKVTVAAINGACAGAAFGWACACDLRYSKAGASFNTAFLGVGMSGDMANPWLLPRILGATKARELCFLPGKFKAEEALRIGLVANVFSEDAFTDEVDVIIHRLAKSAPLALGGMKKNFVNAENMPLRDYIELETERHVRSGKSKDSREAVKAFIEKREPVFEGR